MMDFYHRNTELQTLTTFKRRANVNQLQQRAIKLIKQYQDYEHQFAILDLSDAKQYL